MERLVCDANIIDQGNLCEANEQERMNKKERSCYDEHEKEEAPGSRARPMSGHFGSRTIPANIWTGLVRKGCCCPT